MNNSRGGFSTSGQYFSSVAVQKGLMDATEEVKNQSSEESRAWVRLQRVMMDCKCHKVCRQMRSFFAGRSWMTVYCLMVTVRTSPISCQLQLDKATFLDNPQADLFCTSSTRTSHKYSREKNVADHFAAGFHASSEKVQDAPRACTLLRTDSEEGQRTRCIHLLATILVDTPTSSGQILKANPTDCQYLGAGRRASNTSIAGSIQQKFSCDS